MSDNGSIVTLDKVSTSALVQALLKRHCAGCIALVEDNPRIIGQSRKRFVTLHGDPSEAVVSAEIIKQAAMQMIMASMNKG